MDYLNGLVEEVLACASGRKETRQHDEHHYVEIPSYPLILQLARQSTSALQQLLAEWLSAADWSRLISACCCRELHCSLLSALRSTNMLLRKSQLRGLPTSHHPRVSAWAQRWLIKSEVIALPLVNSSGRYNNMHPCIVPHMHAMLCFPSSEKVFQVTQLLSRHALEQRLEQLQFPAMQSEIQQLTLLCGNTFPYTTHGPVTNASSFVYLWQHLRSMITRGDLPNLQCIRLVNCGSTIFELSGLSFDLHNVQMKQQILQASGVASVRRSVEKKHAVPGNGAVIPSVDGMRDNDFLFDIVIEEAAEIEGAAMVKILFERMIHHHCSGMRTLSVECTIPLSDDLVNTIGSNCHNLERVSLRGSALAKVSDATMGTLISGCQQCLEYATLRNGLLCSTQATNALAACSRLTSIDLSNCISIDGHGLRMLLARSGLKRVLLGRNAYADDTACMQLAHFSSETLKEFSLRDNNFLTDGVVLALAEKCMMLQLIDLSGCSQLTYLSLAALAAAGAKYQQLCGIDISRNKNFTTAMATTLAECCSRRLKVLNIQGIGPKNEIITVQQLAWIRQHCGGRLKLDF